MFNFSFAFFRYLFSRQEQASTELTDAYGELANAQNRAERAEELLGYCNTRNDNLVALIKDLRENQAPVVDIPVLALASKTVVWQTLTEWGDDGIVKAYMSDEEYGLTSIEEMSAFLKEDCTNEYVYGNSYDCDDFSYRLMGNLSVPGACKLAVGIIWVIKENGECHALNCFIDDMCEAYMIEPQTDAIFSKPSGWRVVVIMM